MQLGELAQYLLGALVLNERSLNRNLHDLVSALVPPGIINSLFAKAKLLAVLRAGRDLQKGPAVDGGDFDLGAETGFGDGDGDADIDLVTIAAEEWVLFD